MKRKSTMRGLLLLCLFLCTCVYVSTIDEFCSICFDQQQDLGHEQHKVCAECYAKHWKTNDKCYYCRQPFSKEEHPMLLLTKSGTLEQLEKMTQNFPLILNKEIWNEAMKIAESNNDEEKIKFFSTAMKIAESNNDEEKINFFSFKFEHFCWQSDSVFLCLISFQ
jgi:predicted amidophosphoribosyltransferase